jgi:signal transduction histidine kinase
LSEAAGRWGPKSRSHSFTARVAKSIPRVQADKRAISAVLDELIDNAVKFSPDGGTIELAARRTSDGVELAVTDEGIGLEADTLDRLSAAFVQAEPGETRRFGGLGLGLTFAAGVLAAHGTHLDVARTKDGGAAFSFTLPSVGMVSRTTGRSGGNDEVKR